MSTLDILLLSENFLKIAASIDDYDELLPLNENQNKWKKGYPDVWVVDMDPVLFLELTTTSNDRYPSMDHLLNPSEELGKELKPVEFYKQEDVNKDMMVAPHLSIDINTGRCSQHEGRHRAAAVARAGGKRFRVFVLFTGKKDFKKMRPEQIPLVWENQFTSKRVDIGRALVDRRIKVVEELIGRW